MRLTLTLEGPSTGALLKHWEDTMDYRRTLFETREEAEAAVEPGETVGDCGPHTWPRFKVIAIPTLGDPVSSAFNGDYYPEGEIVKVSKGPAFRRVETSTGKVFFRTRNGTGSGWLHGRMWSLVSGHHDRRNPHL